MALKLAFISTIIALVASVASGLLISTEKLTYNEAVMFCASQGNSRLADVTTPNREQVIHELNGHSAWVGSWDYNFYSGQCLEMTGQHIGPIDCTEKHYAACNSPVVYKSTGEDKPSGARASRRHQKPCHVPEVECVRDCAPRCGYEYVYMTRNVDQVFTSVDVVISFSSTFTSLIYTATVNAYVSTSATTA